MLVERSTVFGLCAQETTGGGFGKVGAEKRGVVVGILLMGSL